LRPVNVVMLRASLDNVKSRSNENVAEVGSTSRRCHSDSFFIDLTLQRFVSSRHLSSYVTGHLRFQVKIVS
jgi:hypothetical protein